jgi:hypothetical protein
MPEKGIRQNPAPDLEEVWKSVTIQPGFTLLPLARS